ncbi:MAG: hypothetical protein PHC46_03935 [Clostridia bacterium]|nr:hypothetical protein [Clostridia bacterium]
MKFRALSLILIFLFASCIGVSSGCDSSNNVVIFAEEASYELNTMTARVGDVIEFNDNPFNVVPASLLDSCIFSSSNPSVASVDALSGEINCLSEGTSIIFGRAKSSQLTFIGDSFTLTVAQSLIYASGFTLQYENEIIVGLDGDAMFNIISLQGTGVNVMPTISYSVNGVATYNYENGLITPISVGEVNIFITLVIDEQTNLTKEFSVIVVDQILYIDAQTIYESTTNNMFYITYSVKDNTKENGLATVQIASAEIVSGESLIDIIQADFQAILIETFSVTGLAVVKLTYVADATITKNIGININ